MRLYFNFSSYLMFYTGFLYLCFKKYFQCKNKFTPLFTCQVHISKFSFPQRTTNFKILKTPLPSAREKESYKSWVLGWVLTPRFTNYNVPIQ